MLIIAEVCPAPLVFRYSCEFRLYLQICVICLLLLTLLFPITRLEVPNPRCSHIFDLYYRGHNLGMEGVHNFRKI